MGITSRINGHEQPLIGRVNGHNREASGSVPAPPRHRRTLLIAGGIVSLLVGALALAGQDRGSGDSGAASSPASEGGSSVSTSAAGHSREGAAATASRYAELLGGDGMFNPARRRVIVDSVTAAGVRDELRKGFDADYSTEFNRRIGLDAQGRPAAGQTFINRTLPTRTTVTSYSGQVAVVDVWASGQVGVTGPGSKTPVTTNWFTLHFTLQWEGTAWKLVDVSQTDGPKP